MKRSQLFCQTATTPVVRRRMSESPNVSSAAASAVGAVKIGRVAARIR